MGERWITETFLIDSTEILAIPLRGIRTNSPFIILRRQANVDHVHARWIMDDDLRSGKIPKNTRHHKSKSSQSTELVRILLYLRACFNSPFDRSPRRALGEPSESLEDQEGLEGLPLRI